MNNYKKVTLLLISSFFIVSAYTQIGEDAVLFTTSVGVANAKNKTTGNSSDGYSLLASLEKMTIDGNSAIGFNFGIIRTDSEGQGVSYQTTIYPALLTGRYLFGSEKLKGYVGIGLGIHISSIIQSDDYEDRITNPAANIPLGINWIFNEGIYLNANYTFNYFSRSYYTNDLVHTFTIGVGIQLGK